MATVKLDESNQPYRQLQEIESSTNKSFLNSKTKIEEVLIYLHSFSSKYQLRAFFITAWHCFVIGMHVFTFVYIFLSPEYDSDTQESTYTTFPPIQK